MSEEAQQASGDVAPDATTQPADTSAPEGAEGAAPAEGAQEAAPAEDPTYEFNWRGQAHQLTKAQADYLFAFGADAYANAMEKQQQGGQEPAEAEVQEEVAAPEVGDPTELKELKKQIGDLNKTLHDLKIEREAEKLSGQIDKAIAKEDFFKAVAGNKEAESAARKMISAFAYGRNISIDQAAKEVAKSMGTSSRSRSSRSSRTRMRAARNVVDRPGGEAPSSGRRMTAKDWKNGNVMKAARERLLRDLD